MEQGAETRFKTGDVGMNKNVTASITFNNGANQIQAANGTFSAFAVGDPILIEGTNLNNGFETVTAIDTVNGAYLVTDSVPKQEGPINATIRTA